MNILTGLTPFITSMGARVGKKKQHIHTSIVEEYLDMFN